MKKLLTILGAALITVSSSSTIVSCSYGNGLSKVVKKQQNFYSKVSAEAIKSLILADQEVTIDGKQVHINLDYSSNVFSRRTIKSIFPEFNETNEDATSLVAELYKTTFGTYENDNSQGGNRYSIKRDFNTFKDSIKQNTTMAKIIKGESIENDIKPDSSISSTLALISSGLNIALGNDFTPTLAGMVTGALNSSTIKNAITDDIINKVNGILKTISENEDAIQAILKSITQEELSNHKDYTNGQVMSLSTNRLFASIFYFMNQPNDKNDGRKINDELIDDKSSEIFFNSLLNKELVDDSNTTIVENTKKQQELFKAIANIIFFANTFIHYMSMFDEYKNSESGSYLSGNKIFDKNTENGFIIKEISEKKYKSNVYDWYSEKNNKNELIEYSVINLQSIASAIQFYLSPDSKLDPKGYNTLRFFNILLGNKAYKTVTGDKTYLYNDFIDTILNKGLFNSLSIKIDGLLSKTDKSKIKKLKNELIVNKLNNSKSPISKAIIELINSVIQNTINWITSDGYIENDNSSAFDSLINVLEKILPILKIAEGIIKNDVFSKIVSVINDIVKTLKSDSGRKMLEHPWSELYNGNLLREIGKLIDSFTNNNSWSDKLGKIKNVKNLLTTNLNDILTTFGLTRIPDWLYDLRKTSIADIVDMMSKTFKTNRYNSPDENRSYFLNTQDLKNIVSSLLPSTSGVKSGEENKTLIEPLLNVIKKTTNNGKWTINTDGKDIELTDAQGNWNIDAINMILGLNKDKNRNGEFTKNSFLYNLSRIYGHNYFEATEFGNNPNFITDDKGDISKMTKSASKVFSLFMQISDFTKVSIENLVKDNYDKYFDPKVWKINDVKSYGLDLDLTSDDSVGQTLSYNLSFNNIDENRWYKYDIELKRDALKQTNPNNDKGWYVTKVFRQN